MKALKYLFIALAGIFIFIACKKELSFETGTLTGLAEGSLKDIAGDCMDADVVGQYIKDSTLKDSSYVVVQVNFSAPGMYKIFTDTENGFSFSDSGYMVSTGLQNVKLKATGKPLATQQTNFTVYFDSSFCMFSVQVSDTFVVKRNAAYTLASTGTTCANATVRGTYQAGTALDPATNTASIDVTVTAPGSYNISTTAVNGMTFSRKGTFATTGTQTVVLRGNGTPTTAETDSIPVTAGGTSCKFGVVVVAAGTGGGGNPIPGTWEFTQGSTTYSGTPIVGGFVDTAGQAFLGLVGISLKDSITIGIQLKGRTIDKGDYVTGGTSYNNFNYLNGGPSRTFFSDPNTTGAAVTITITNYDAINQIVTGTFKGTAYNSANVVVPITNGKFNAYVAR
ncbi:MAG TPA: hypothetical protein VF623_01800 [Segetibacter sp.]|jgi:hypothetical protein